MKKQQTNMVNDKVGWAHTGKGMVNRSHRKYGAHLRVFANGKGWRWRVSLWGILIILWGGAPASALAQVGQSGQAGQSAAPEVDALSAVPKQSVFAEYQKWSDENKDDRVKSWPQSNAAVGALGGWRAYAREASQMQRALHAQAAAEVLRRPLTEVDAVRWALANSPAWQAALALQAATAATAAATVAGTEALFSVDRLRRGNEVEILQLLSLGMPDLFTPSQVRSSAELQVGGATADQKQKGQAVQAVKVVKAAQENRWRLVVSIIEKVTQVRQAWVRAIAAQQARSYAQQIQDLAHSSAELALRMQKAGNFTRLDRARQQAFYANTTTALALAQHTSAQARDHLARLLGFSEQQAANLVLPDRLPEPPSTAHSAQEIAKMAMANRLDIRQALAAFESAAKAQGLATSDIFREVASGVRAADSGSGYAHSMHISPPIPLPIFDGGGKQRGAMQPSTRAAADHLEDSLRAAGSHLRTRYSGYRTALDVSNHFRREVLPLQKIMAEENQLLYNGMFIGVFELLANSRDEIRVVMASIAAQEQFWLAEIALQSALAGGMSTGEADSAGDAVR